MTTNPLLGLLGPQFCRFAGGPLLPLRGTLRMQGASLTDVEADDRQDVTLAAAATVVTFNAALDAPGDFWTHTADWFGVSDDFIAANIILLTADAVDGRIAGFAVPSGASAVYRKVLVNVGTNPVELFNFRLEDTEDPDPGGNDPGMLECQQRMLRAGDSARLVWDPVSQHWLVNAGLYSGEYVTHDNEIVTDDDGTPITEGV